MKKKISSNKNFGIVFFIFFLIIGIWPLFYSGNIKIWSIILSLIFLALGIFNSRILTPLNLFWVKFGELLGLIIAPIVMALVFFLIVTPMSFLIKLLGKDLLKTKNFNEKSYWIRRKSQINSMDKQF